jgi:hypothetical protein
MDNRAVRRKILQGTLAAPVVLTVSSASAQAISSFGRCIQRLTAQQPTNFFTNSASADTWFRSRVPVVEIFKGSHKQGTFYFDPKIGSYVNVVSPYAVFTGFTGAVAPSKGPWKLGAVGARWALVYFEPTSATPYSNAMGRTIITLQKPSGYLATSMSCYGSFTRRA